VNSENKLTTFSKNLIDSKEVIVCLVEFIALAQKWKKRIIHALVELFQLLQRNNY